MRGFLSEKLVTRGGVITITSTIGAGFAAKKTGILAERNSGDRL